MPDYRRLRVPGGTYFFTVNLSDRNSTLLTDQIDLLRDCVRRVRHRRRFHIDAWVILPDHMHALWTLPEDDSNYAYRWQAIKMLFSRQIVDGERRSKAAAARGERGIWQRRYWEHMIRNEADYAAHMDYIHFNPVKHGVAASPANWPHSTFRRAVANGLYPPDWSNQDDDTDNKGERP